MALRRVVGFGLAASTALLLGEVAYATLRKAPVQPEFDPSGVFGDESQPILRVVVLGDSSVTAPGVDEADQIWVRLICRRLAESRHVVLHSVAKGGATAHTVVEQQLDDAVGFGADLALISVGGNDMIRGVDLKRFETDLNLIVSDLVAGGTRVVLSGVGDLGTIPRLTPPLRSLVSWRSGAYHRIHQKVGQRHGVAWVDMRDDNRSLWIRDRSLWSPDLFHVSPSGHARWAELGWPTVAETVASIAPPGSD